MKVLQVYKDIFPEVSGGIERYIHDFSSYLIAEGHSVEAIVAGGGNRRVDGVSVKGVPTLGRLLSTPISLGYQGALERTDADVIHFHLPLPTAVLSWFLTKKSNRTPYVVTYHSDIVRQAFVMPFYGPILRKFLKNADKVIATSPKYISSSVYLKTLSNVVSIPIGVDLKKFYPTTSVTRDYYLFVGRFRAYKGIFVLLEAWKQMKKVNSIPKLLLVGGGGQINQISEYIADNNLPISVLTDVDDKKLLSLYQDAKALILPSIHRSEAFGMVQVEAMACATPVISSNLSTGVSWVNQDNVTGKLFETGSSDSLIKAIVAFEDGSVSIDKMGKNARNRAVSEFDAVKLFAQVEGCLKKAAKIGN